MILPSKYRFPKTTLLLVANRMHARLFVLHADRLDEIDSMESDGFPLDDKEKYSIQVTDGVHAGGEDERIRDRVGAEFFRDVGRRLHLLFQKGLFARLIIVIPEEYHRQLVNGMPPDVQRLLLASLFGEFTHEHPLVVLERVQSKHQ